MNKKTIAELTLDTLVSYDKEYKIENGVRARVLFAKIKRNRQSSKDVDTIIGRAEDYFSLDLCRYIETDGSVEVTVEGSFTLDELWNDISTFDEKDGRHKTEYLQVVSVTLLDFATRKRIRKTEVYPIDDRYFILKGKGMHLSFPYYREENGEITIKNWKSCNEKKEGGRYE